MKTIITSLLILVILCLVGYYVWVINNDESRPKSENTGVVESSGIALTYPKDVPEGNIISSEYFEIQIKLDQRYWESLGNKSLVSNSLTISKGVASIGGSGRGCSIENYSEKGSSTSTIIVQIDDQPFYKVIQSDNGMNQTYNVERYVQMLNATQCRFIEFLHHWANPGAYYSEKEDIKKMNKDNETFANILKLRQQEIFENIKVENPVYSLI
jgi:hypothetical protein